MSEKVHEYEQHPLVAGLLPPHDGQQKGIPGLAAGTAAVAAPVLLYEGKVLDGWATYLACRAAGNTPAFVEFAGSREEALVVWSGRNFGRRHLTKSQLAAVAVRLLPRLREEAGRRKRAGTRSAHHPQTVGEGRDKHSGEAAQRAADMVGTNRTYVEMASRLQRLDSARFEQVWQGEVSLPAAVAAIEAALQKVRRAAPGLAARVEKGTLPLAEAAEQVAGRQTEPTEVASPRPTQEPVEEMATHAPTPLDMAWDATAREEDRLRFLGRTDVAPLARELFDAADRADTWLTPETRWVTFEGRWRSSGDGRRRGTWASTTRPGN